MTGHNSSVWLGAAYADELRACAARFDALAERYVPPPPPSGSGVKIYRETDHDHELRMVEVRLAMLIIGASNDGLLTVPGLREFVQFHTGPMGAPLPASARHGFPAPYNMLADLFGQFWPTVRGAVLRQACFLVLYNMETFHCCRSWSSSGTV